MDHAVEDYASDDSSPLRPWPPADDVGEDDVEYWQQHCYVPAQDETLPSWWHAMVEGVPVGESGPPVEVDVYHGNEGHEDNGFYGPCLQPQWANMEMRAEDDCPLCFKSAPEATLIELKCHQRICENCIKRLLEGESLKCPLCCQEECLLQITDVINKN